VPLEEEPTTGLLSGQNRGCTEWTRCVLGLSGLIHPGKAFSGITALRRLARKPKKSYTRGSGITIHK